MKIALLYGSDKYNDGTQIRVGATPSGKNYYVRMEIVDDTNLIDALDQAKPTENEVVLNSVEVE